MLSEQPQFTTLKNGWIQRNSDSTLFNLHKFTTVEKEVLPDGEGYRILLCHDEYNVVFPYPLEQQSLEEGQTDYAEHNWGWDFQRLMAHLSQ